MIETTAICYVDQAWIDLSLCLAWCAELTCCNLRLALQAGACHAAAPDRLLDLWALP